MTAEMESEGQSMCNLSTAIENKGIKKGLERGLEQGLEQGIDIGELRATVKYYKKGKLTLEEAAEDLNMTVEEFTEKMNQIPAEAI